jgi:hypothetical protein
MTDGFVVRALAARGVSLVKTPASMTTRAFDDGIRGEEASLFLRDRCPVSTRKKLWAETVFVRITGSSFVLTLFRSSCLLRET